MRYAAIFFAVLATLVGQNASAQATWPDSNVVIIQPDEPLPAGLEKKGNFEYKPRDADQMESSYRNSLRSATAKAVRLGGNVLKITSLKNPGSFRACWHTEGEIYHALNLSGVKAAAGQHRDSVLGIAQASHKGEALIIFYRNYENTAYGVDAFINDSVVNRFKPGSALIIHVPAGRLVKIAAGKQQAREINATPQLGQIIFVKLSVALSAGKVSVGINGSGGSIPSASARLSLAAADTGWEEARILLQ